MQQSADELPLSGIRVIEFTHMVMGPSAGMILADLGAEVIKIEPLGGDKTRRLQGSGAGYFPMYNRNKKSICIDLKSGRGREVAERLAAGADILIENFRPGAMDRLGFGWEAMRKANPGLIYCSLKGFLSGPFAHRTALDEVAQMMGGLAYMTGLPDRPMRAGASVIDVAGGMFGVIAALAALERRRRSGRGELVTGSLFETTAFFVGQHMAQQAVTGEAALPMSIRRSAWAIYDIFQCREGEKVFVGVVSDTQWRGFCEEFDLADFAADESLAQNNARVRQRDRILPEVERMFAALGRDEMLARLERCGVAFALVNKPADLFDDPHLNAAGGLLPVSLRDGERAGSNTRLPALPIEWGGERFGIRHDLPAAGEHCREILAAAGFSERESAELERLGLVRGEPESGNSAE
ncbi:MAG: CaiB/BaiF CoA-transferase family protein [Gammaproteobacteria bacterium]|nr:CaiB/BaiF CoA-transferase family protein [Gammaproteobacteria bacterium]